MGETTGIEWADSTVNIWLGCQETGSPACVGCYARQLVEGRFGLTTWGPHGKRVETKSWRSNLRKISRLAKAAFAAGRTEPWFVFVNSLSDFWDNQADPKLRAEALAEFRKHPHLTFLLLTKRPQMIVKLFCEALNIQKGAPCEELLPTPAEAWPRNVAIGCTVVTQAEANRDIPWLLRAAAALRPAFAFLSMEPLVEIVDISCWLGGSEPSIGWVITGGGTDQGKHKAYPTHVEAFRKVRDDCAAADVPYLHKQNGEWLTEGQEGFDGMNHLGIEGAKKFWLKEANAGRVVEWSDVSWSHRVGKKAAGRLLDGRTHDERPKVAA